MTLGRARTSGNRALRAGRNSCLAIAATGALLTFAWAAGDPRIRTTNHATICHTYTKDLRNETLERRHRIFQRWGIPYSKHLQFELDHQVPLCLGGSDDDANLWPQPLAEARIKDKDELEACIRVCEYGADVKGEQQRMIEKWPQKKN